MPISNIRHRCIRAVDVPAAPPSLTQAPAVVIGRQLPGGSSFASSIPLRPLNCAASARNHDFPHSCDWGPAHPGQGAGHSRQGTPSERRVPAALYPGAWCCHRLLTCDVAFRPSSSRSCLRPARLARLYVSVTSPTSTPTSICGPCRRTSRSSRAAPMSKPRLSP